MVEGLVFFINKFHENQGNPLRRNILVNGFWTKKGVGW